MATVRKWLLGLVMLAPITGVVGTAIAVAAPTATVGAAAGEELRLRDREGSQVRSLRNRRQMLICNQVGTGDGCQEGEGKPCRAFEGSRWLHMHRGNDERGNGVQVSGNCSKGIGLGNSPYFNWSTIRGPLESPQGLPLRKGPEATPSRFRSSIIERRCEIAPIAGTGRTLRNPVLPRVDAWNGSIRHLRLKP